MGLSGTILGTYTARRHGVDIEYNIEIATMAMKDELIELMTTYFIPRETLCMATGILQDSVSLRSITHRWGEIIESETALVAIIRQPNQTPIIIGANMTYIPSNNDVSLFQTFEGEAMLKIANGLRTLTDKSNVPEVYQVTTWLDAFGLCVHSSWHGCRVGERLLESREHLCRLLRLRVTFTAFTAVKAQALARKVGMETLAEIDAGEVIACPPLKGVIIKGMAKSYS